MLSQDTREIQTLDNNPHFAEIFADMVVKEFLGEVAMKYLDGPLRPGEMPKEQVAIS